MTMMSTVLKKPKLTLTSNHYEKVRKLAERGELTELKDYIRMVLAYRFYHHTNPNFLRQCASVEQGLIRSRPVIKAAQNGQYHVVEYFVAEYSDIVDYSSDHSNNATTALHSAAEMGHVGILKLLTEPSIEVNYRDTNTGRTPLHSAVHSGQEAAIRYLLSCRADVNAADTNGRTPLHEVILRHTSGEHGKDYAWLCRAVQMLLKRGASMYQADHDGRTAVHNIAQLDDSASLELLKALLNSSPELASSKVLQMPSKGQRYTELPAILYAAEWRNEPFVDFITSQPECSPAIAADALLALSTYQNTDDKIIELWEKALRRLTEEYLPSSSDYGSGLQTCSLDAHELIPVATESDTFTDLHYQFLIMRECIFGIGSRATIQYLWKLGHELCEKNCFVEANQLYTKALKMMVLNGTGEYSQPGCYI